MANQFRDSSDPGLADDNSNGLMSAEDFVKLGQYPTLAQLLAQIASMTSLSKTVTPTGTTGAQTINTPLGTVNFAAGTQSLIVTSSLSSTNSIIFPVGRTNDQDAVVDSIVPGNGSFQIFLSNPALSELSVGFLIFS